MNVIFLASAPGKITMETTPYSGNNYRIFLSNGSYGSNLVLNADGDGATDWNVSGATQIGDYWLEATMFLNLSIVNGTNGFSNRAQRAECQNGSSQIFLFSNNFNITNAYGKNYHLWMQYRSSHTLQVLQITAYHTTGTGIVTVSANTGNAINYEYQFTAQNDNFLGLWFRVDGTPDINNNVWLEIDKVSLKEVL